MPAIENNEPSPQLASFLRDALGVDGAESAAAWKYRGAVWLWRGSHGDGSPTKAAWYFVTIDGDVAAAIQSYGASRGAARPGARRGGFGAVRIVATIGATSWQTSLFPSTSAGGYLLPVKASVRRAEQLDVGSVVDLLLAGA